MPPEPQRKPQYETERRPAHEQEEPRAPRPGTAAAAREAVSLSGLLRPP